MMAIKKEIEARFGSGVAVKGIATPEVSGKLEVEVFLLPTHARI